MSTIADLRRMQDERELFHALNEGLRCAEAAAKSIAYTRQEGRWSQIGMLLAQLRAKANELEKGRQRPKLVLPEMEQFNGKGM